MHGVLRRAAHQHVATDADEAAQIYCGEGGGSGYHEARIEQAGCCGDAVVLSGLAEEVVGGAGGGR